jgi:hypothetical protein
MSELILLFLLFNWLALLGMVMFFSVIGETGPQAETPETDKPTQLESNRVTTNVLEVQAPDMDEAI